MPFPLASIDLNTLFAGVGGALAVAIAGAVASRVKERRIARDRREHADADGIADLKSRVSRMEEFMLGKKAVGGWRSTRGFIDEWPKFQQEMRDALRRIETGVNNGNGNH